jgi:hypothetical protein
VADDWRRKHPLFQLGEADLEFIVRMVLASGSLKELARAYGVSYPTIRSTLDKLIERVQRAVEGRPVDPMLELLADLVERGELTPSGARQVRAQYRQVAERKERSGT